MIEIDLTIYQSVSQDSPYYNEYWNLINEEEKFKWDIMMSKQYNEAYRMYNSIDFYRRQKKVIRQMQRQLEKVRARMAKIERICAEEMSR